MAGPGRKPIGKEKMVLCSFSLLPETKRALEEEACITGVTTAAMGRMAIEKFLRARALSRKLNVDGL